MINMYRINSMAGKMWCGILLMMIGDLDFSWSPKGFGKHSPPVHKGSMNMLWTIFVMVVMMWLMGLISSKTVGDVVDIPLMLGLAILLLNLLPGRRSAV